MAPPPLLIPWLWLANPPGMFLFLTLYKPSISYQSLQPCRWTQYFPRKQWCTAKILHTSTIQKTIYCHLAMRT
jgi:hypothetical protein